MKKFKIFIKIFSLCLIACCLFIALGCKKDKDEGSPNPFTTPAVIVSENLTTNTTYNV